MPPAADRSPITGTRRLSTRASGRRPISLINTIPSVGRIMSPPAARISSRRLTAGTLSSFSNRVIADFSAGVRFGLSPYKSSRMVFPPTRAPIPNDPNGVPPLVASPPPNILSAVLSASSSSNASPRAARPGAFTARIKSYRTFGAITSGIYRLSMPVPLSITEPFSSEPGSDGKEPRRRGSRVSRSTFGSKLKRSARVGIISCLCYPF